MGWTPAFAGVTRVKVKGAWGLIPVRLKIDLSLSFRRKPESTFSAALPMGWTPVFTGVTRVKVKGDWYYTNGI